MSGEGEVEKKAPAAEPKAEEKTDDTIVKKPTGEAVRPNRGEFNNTVADIDGKIKVCKAELDSVKESLDKLAESKKSGDKSNEPQLKLNELRAKTRAIMDERKKMFDQLKSNKEARQGLKDTNDSMKKTLSAGGCYSVAEVEKKIRDLEYYLATNPLSVKEEKVVIADIKKLSNSKKIIGEYDTLKGKKDVVEATSKEISVKLDASKIEMAKAKAAEDAQYKIVAEIRAKNNTKAEYQALFDRRNTARKEMNSLYDKLRKVRDTFRKQEDAWQKMMQEKRKEQRERQRIEQEMYKEEMKFAKLKKEEEAEEGLHADKFASIDQLVNYLEALTASPEKKEEAAPVKIQEVEGMTLIGKRSKVMEDDIYGTKKAGKKKGGKKKGGKKKAGISHDLKVLQEFETLKVEAPLSQDDIPTAVAALKGKIADLKKDKESRREKRLAKLAAAEADVKAKNEKKEAAAAKAKEEGKTEDKKEEPTKDEAAAATKSDEAKTE